MHEIFNAENSLILIGIALEMIGMTLQSSGLRRLWRRKAEESVIRRNPDDVSDIDDVHFIKISSDVDKTPKVLSNIGFGLMVIGLILIGSPIILHN